MSPGQSRSRPTIWDFEAERRRAPRALMVITCPQACGGRAVEASSCALRDLRGTRTAWVTSTLILNTMQLAEQLFFLFLFFSELDTLSFFFSRFSQQFSWASQVLAWFFFFFFFYFFPLTKQSYPNEPLPVKVKMHFRSFSPRWSHSCSQVVLCSDCSEDFGVLFNGYIYFSFSVWYFWLVFCLVSSFFSHLLHYLLSTFCISSLSHTCMFDLVFLLPDDGARKTIESKILALHLQQVLLGSFHWTRQASC